MTRVLVDEDMPRSLAPSIVASALNGLSTADLAGSLVIVEQKRVRMRQPRGSLLQPT